MANYKYLLIPFSPILAVICLLVFLYERLFLNNQESVENLHTVSKVFLTIWSVFVTVVTCPLVFLGPLGALIRWLFNAAFIAPAAFLKVCFWQPVFLAIVPSLYLRFNSRAYKDS